MDGILLSQALGDNKMFKIHPGILISTLGLIGIMFTFIDNSGQLGGKIPLTIFFLFIIVFGLVLLILPKERIDNLFGEVESPRGFS